jgi:hypothetical protein
VLVSPDLNYLSRLQRKDKNSDDFIVHKHWKNKSDFIGVDYYRRVYIYYSNIVSLSSARFVGGAPINDLNVATEKIKCILLYSHKNSLPFKVNNSRVITVV